MMSYTGWGAHGWGEGSSSRSEEHIFNDWHLQEDISLLTALLSSSTLYSCLLVAAPSPGSPSPPSMALYLHLGKISASSGPAGNSHPSVLLGTCRVPSHPHPLHLQCPCLGCPPLLASTSPSSPRNTSRPSLNMPGLQAPLKLQMLFPLPGTAFLSSGYHLIPSQPYHPGHSPTSPAPPSLSSDCVHLLIYFLYVCLPINLDVVCLVQLCEHTPTAYPWKINIGQ